MPDRTVYVPLPSGLLFGIARGSGVVSRLEPRADALTQAPTEPVEVWFEGNIYGAANIVTLGDRVLHAADRMDHNYPTVAHILAQPGSLVAVGWWNGHAVGPFDSLGEAILSWWLEGAIATLPAAELAATHRAASIPQKDRAGA